MTRTISVYFDTEVDAQRAVGAMPSAMPCTGPRMAEEPFHGRAWVVEVQVEPRDTRAFQVVLEIVNRYGGEVHQEPLTTRPGGAPFMNRMPQSVIDRYEAQQPPS